MDPALRLLPLLLPLRVAPHRENNGATAPLEVNARSADDEDGGARRPLRPGDGGWRLCPSALAPLARVPRGWRWRCMGEGLSLEGGARGDGLNDGVAGWMLTWTGTPVQWSASPMHGVMTQHLLVGD